MATGQQPRCTACGEREPSRFYRRGDRRGYRSRCKSCYPHKRYDSAAAKARYEKNKSAWLPVQAVYRAANKHRIAMRVKAWYERRSGSEAFKAKRKRAKLRAKYGITLDAYTALYERQSGKCAVCDKWQPVLCVDHDHCTNQVRELLCTACNLAFGNLREDPVIIARLLEYARRHKP